MKKSSVAGFTTGLFNPRVLRAAALLPALSVVALHADGKTAVPDSGAAAKPAPVADSKKSEKLPDAVVVASRREESIDDVSPGTGLITAGEMQTRQLETLGQALATQPGVFVSGSGLPTGLHQSVFTRGTNSNMTSVLLDGRRLSPGIDGSSEIERYSTGGLDSVQFARGANSTLYGANAIGGVIDMRTVDPLRLQAPTGFAGVEAGSFGTVKGTAGASGSTSVLAHDSRKDLGATVSGDWRRSDGPFANSGYDGNHALGRVDFSPVQGVTFDTLAQAHDFKNGLPGSVTAPTPADSQIDRGWLISPGVTFANDDDFKARLFYSRTHSEIVSHFVSFASDSNANVDMDQVSLQADWTPAKRLVLSAGYDYDRTDFAQISTGFFGTSTRIAWDSHSSWGRAVLTSNDRTSEIGVGGRYQWFDDFRDAATGEIFASQAIPATGTKIFAKLANSYSTPTAQDYLYNFSPLPGPLKPERGVSYEAGVRQKFFEKTSPLEISATFFQNDMTDLISFIQSPPGSFNYLPFNIGKARVQGVELALDWRPVKQLRFYANGTIQDARAKTADIGNGVTAGDPLARRPDCIANFGVEVSPVKTVTFGIGGVGVMKQTDAGNVPMGDYFVARAYASWRFCENAEVFGRVENIFDENYDAAGIGFRGMPPGAYGGLRLRF